ncbi:hypothetical protein OAE74_01710 [Verrucomicrobia bacterium]|nr:hypothetical protein [Verrucomicrobiota bacterium]
MTDKKQTSGNASSRQPDQINTEGKSSFLKDGEQLIVIPIHRIPRAIDTESAGNPQTKEANNE